MTCRWAARGGPELYYYAELAADAYVRFRAHLAGCETCQRALAELDIIGTALGRRRAAEPPGGDWEPFMERLAQRMAQEQARRTASAHRAARLVRIAAGLAIAASGLAGGVGWQRWWAGRATPVATAVVAAPAEPRAEPSPAGAALTLAAEEHLERAKVVLFGLTTLDPRRMRPDDWHSEQRLASALLADTAQYRLAASEQGRADLADVLGDLETVLLDVSLGQADRAAVSRVQRFIDRRDLLTRIQVMATGDEERPRR